jgi:hypothetical protein
MLSTDEDVSGGKPQDMETSEDTSSSEQAKRDSQHDDAADSVA